MRKPVSRAIERKLRDKAKGKCMWCRKQPAQQVHHIDGNRRNSKPGNLILLCGTCHIKAHSEQITREQLLRRLGIRRLDTETRRYIEALLDTMCREFDLLGSIDWILEAHDEIASEDDLALGYFLGIVVATGSEIAQNRRMLEKFQERNRRQEKKWEKELQKKLGEEKAAEIIRKSHESAERAKEKAKTAKPPQVSLTDEERDDLREMLKSKIGTIREKIRKERARRLKKRTITVNVKVTGDNKQDTSQARI